jgi:hypothetical protein
MRSQGAPEALGAFAESVPLLGRFGALPTPRLRATIEMGIEQGRCIGEAVNERVRFSAR